MAGRRAPIESAHARRLSPRSERVYPVPGRALGSDADVGQPWRRWQPADLRAWLAWLSGRGRARTSTARAMASIRSFCRFLDRRQITHVPAILAVRTPKLPHAIPRALASDEALAVVEDAETISDDPWIAARDVALFSLLYGCGLRIGEALALPRRAAPFGEMLRVVGKGDKERVVPVLPAGSGCCGRLCRPLSLPSRRRRRRFVSRREGWAARTRAWCNGRCGMRAAV